MGLLLPEVAYARVRGDFRVHRSRIVACEGRAVRMTYTHVTAPTEFVEAGGIRHAYRRFGANSGVPLIFMPHYRAGMDHWDPAVTDGFANSRPVILFDNAGVSGSSGETPDTMEAMADR